MLRNVRTYIIAAAFLAVATAGRLVAAEPQKAEPAKREAAKTYTFRGHAIAYPESWKLREKTGGASPGASGTIYKPAGGDSFTAWWYFDRKPDPDNRKAEEIRDRIARSLATTMKGFKAKDKGSLTVDGRRAAYVTFEHAEVDPPCVSRHVFIPNGDGTVTMVAETAVAAEWDQDAPVLDGITRSIKFPK